MGRNWHNISVEEILEQLNSGPHGLTHTEAENRLRAYGPNELMEKGKTPVILVFILQFASPLIYILLIASIV
jgi:P-type Ca2+ transporter type 2C